MVPCDEEEHYDDYVMTLYAQGVLTDRKTRLNSSHTVISYAVFCLKKKKETNKNNKTNPTEDGPLNIIALPPA